MYECYRGKTVDGYESFSTPWIIGENVLFLALWTTAGWLLWPLQVAGWPIATIIWILFVVFFQVALKKHFCSGCAYYGKSCHLGWGRLAAKLFAADSGDQKMGLTMAVPMYMLSPVVVLVLGIVVGLVMTVSVAHWIVLGVFVALNVVSFRLRTTSCGKCKMRAVCPGSAVKPMDNKDG